MKLSEYFKSLAKKSLDDKSRDIGLSSSRLQHITKQLVERANKGDSGDGWICDSMVTLIDCELEELLAKIEKGIKNFDFDDIK